MMMIKAFIFLNGEFPKDKIFYQNLAIDEKHLYCADGGAEKALELGYKPTEVWGDFDSLEEENVDKLKEMNVKIKSFEKNKDYTDGELLLEYVYNKKYKEIYVVGGLGKRIDHTLTNINLIFKYENLIFINEKEELFLAKSEFIIKNKKNKTISFIPFSDKVEDLTLEGFLYPLKNYNLTLGESICMSNVITENESKVKFGKGKLICVINGED